MSRTNIRCSSSDSLPEQIQDLSSDARLIEFEAREQRRESKAKPLANPTKRPQGRREVAVLQAPDGVGRETGNVGQDFLSQSATEAKTVNVLTELLGELEFEFIVS